MKKIIFILSIFCLFSCEQKVKINEENHLQLFNLKGNVKQLNHDYILNEITDISYKPIGKANTTFFRSVSTHDTNLSYIRTLSEFDFYYYEEFFDSYNIFFSQMLSYVDYGWNNYEIKFNSDGNIISIEGFKNNMKIYKIHFEYENNNIIKVKKTEDLRKEDLGKRTETIVEFEYGSNNLITTKKVTENDGYTSNSTFSYDFNKDKNEFSITEVRNEKFSDNETKKSNFNYIMALDNEDKIEKITYEKKNKVISFANGRIKKITQFNKNNELTFNIELNYNGDKISEVKKTKYGKLNEIYFQYDDNGNLKNVKCNDESKKDFINDLRFSYEYDNFKNWTKQSYSIDRAKYDNYLQYLKKREKYSNDYYEVYGYSPFSFKEDVDAEIERKILSKYSSKIDVERRIIYY